MKKLVLLILGLTFLFILSACSESSSTDQELNAKDSQKETKEEETKQKDTPKEKAPKEEKKEAEKPKSFKDVLVAGINKKIGDKSNFGTKRIKELKINDNIGTEAEGDVIVLAHLRADDNLTMNFIRKSILTDTRKFFEMTFKNDTVAQATVFWYFPLTDQYGNESEGVVTKVGLTKETAAKINWDNFNVGNFESVAEQFTIHQDMRK